METSSCDGLKIKEQVDFTVEIKLTKCPERLPNGSFKPIVFNISAQGIGERAQVYIEPMCECDCERESSQESSIKSSYCNDRGQVVCGICECDSMYYGSKCECSKLETHSSESTLGLNKETLATGNISTCIE